MSETSELKQVKHIEHLEDIIFQTGKSPQVLRGIVSDMLDDPEDFAVSVKFDGSPSIVCGVYPDGRFFVSTKSAFNKKPVFLFSYADIDEFCGARKELHDVLDRCFHYLQKVVKEGVWQCDFLFDSESVVKTSEFVSFNPNVIRYEIGLDSPLYCVAHKAKLGVVFHTQYHFVTDDEGKYFLEAFDSPCFSDIGKDDTVFWFDPEFNLYDMIEKMPELEKEMYKTGFDNSARNLFQLEEMDKDIWDKHKDLKKLIRQYVNSRIWENKPFINKEEYLEGFMVFALVYYTNKVEGLSLPTAISKALCECDSLRNFVMIEGKNRHWIADALKLNNDVRLVKNFLINYLDRQSFWNIRCTVNGIPCNHEGYVVRYEHENIFFKLVNREQFSRINQQFSKNKNR